MTYLELAQRGRNAVWRYALAIPAAIVLTVVLGVAILLPLTLTRLAPSNLADQLQHAGNPVVFFLGTGGTFGVLLAGFAIAIRAFHGKRLRDLVGVWSWRAWGQGAGVWLGALALATLIDFLINPKGFTLTISAQTPLLAAVALPALAVQTFAEEFVFRGYFTQGLFLATRRPVATAILSGLVFGSVHIPNGWPQAANAVVFGVALALIAIRTRGLGFGYGLHLVNNFYGAVVVVSGDDVFKGSPGLLTQATPHLMWWDTMFATAILAGVAWLVLSGRIRGGADEADAIEIEAAAAVD
jgi:membrane protease YdiL (CAAX protease family)